MYVLSICLSDIPKEKIQVSEKNGKMYVNVIVTDRREPDKFGNDATVYMSQTKEEREAKADKEYIGQGQKKDDFKTVQGDHPFAQTTPTGGANDTGQQGDNSGKAKEDKTAEAQLAANSTDPPF